MDGTRFDRLTKTLATSSRRSVVKTGLGTMLGLALAGIGRSGADAAVLRQIGQICRKNGDCASDVCLPKDGAGRRRCGECLTAADCVVPASNGECVGAICVDGFCEIGVLVDEPCGGANLCLVDGGVCLQDGTCAGTPIGCEPAMQCQEDGVCDPGTGECTYANKQDGTPCDTGIPNSSGATCQSGTCVCTPQGTDCGQRECGPGLTTCGQAVSCGECSGLDVCDEQTGICEGTN